MSCNCEKKRNGKKKRGRKASLSLLSVAFFFKNPLFLPFLISAPLCWQRRPPLRGKEQRSNLCCGGSVNEQLPYLHISEGGVEVEGREGIDRIADGGKTRRRLSALSWGRWEVGGGGKRDVSKQVGGERRRRGGGGGKTSAGRLGSHGA